MENKYSNERNIQIVISLLKSHGINKVIASPGGASMTFVASLQQDPFFTMYSAADERSAAYIACGLSAETNETVVLSCTGATSSRNYMPGLTEAYYRKLPILAITSGRSTTTVGHHMDQVIDRSVLPKDVAKLSVSIPIVKDKEDEWDAMIKVNKAILELTHSGAGPVHINLPTTYSRDFSVKELPPVRKINRITPHDSLPSLPNGNIGIFVGSHIKWSDELTTTVDRFCESNNAVVLCDHTSNYKGKYQVLIPLIETQSALKKNDLDLLIHIGEVSSSGYNKTREVWRVSDDGELRDTFNKLTCVFEMSELDFFKYYISKNNNTTLFENYQAEYNDLYDRIPDLPFSNIWIAKKLSKELPKGSVLHLAIRNSLRAWNFFEIDNSIAAYSNVGGFGIDGGVSSLIGASFAHPQKLYFGVIGDLAFFYDMNSLGNRHIKNNLRILLINNGRGQEFRNHISMGAMFGEETDKFIAAGGHYGNQSPNLVKHFAQDLGFEYISASNKDDFENVYKNFVSSKITSKPLLFEVFTNTEEENKALKMISSLTVTGKLVQSAREAVNGKTFNLLKEWRFRSDRATHFG
ncbi:MAG: thiamine pyrophosphate-binding protein [Draconibacterium sp.]